MMTIIKIIILIALVVLIFIRERLIKKFKNQNVESITKRMSDATDEMTKWAKYSLDQIFELEIPNSFVIALDMYICKKCNYGEDIDKLSKEEFNFYLTQNFIDEVNNGGFEQFLYNSSGQYVDKVYSALIEVKSVEVAHIYENLLKKYFSKPLPKDEEKRNDKLELIITDEFIKKAEACDSLFYDCTEDFDKLNYDYVQKNKDKFN